MERKKPVAERIRPYLEAMERSIDSARRRRNQTDGDAGQTDSHIAEPTAGKPLQQQPTFDPARRAASAQPHASQPARPSGGDEAPPRLKAKPKRPENLRNNGPTWRSAS